MMRNHSRSAAVHGASIAALAIAMSLPAGALAQSAPQAPAQPAATPGSPTQPVAAPPELQAGETQPAGPLTDDTSQDIVVTGFRQSLQAALNVKKNSVAAVDSIVAEDIAKFPDQNLAESLQRIPGISIQRDGGEGRAITVRGLGAQFTRVRVNGLETVATSSDGASANRDRAFDFNVFASELFSSLVVHKTAEASLDEGSLGAVVDLNTGNPLGGKKPGFTGALSVQGSYNTLSKNVGPRAAGLLSWRNDAGTFGASVSAAYSKTNTLELGNNTTRWAQAQFDSVDGTPCYYTTTGTAAANNLAFTNTPARNTGGTYRQSAACDKAAQAFHPRIPRYGVVRHERERLGLTGSVQFAPTDATKVSIDGLYSKFKETREEQWLEVLLRSNERSIDLVNPVYDANNNIVSATLNDAYNRNEHYLRKSSTEFYQIGGTWDQDVSDKFRFTLLGGLSKSDASIPVETTLLFDNKSAQGYKYDYTNMNNPVLSYGTSVTDPASYQLSEIRDRPSDTVNKFRTVQLRTEWDVAEGFQIKAGGVYRKFTFDTAGFTRDTVVCGNGGKDLVLGTLTCSPTTAIAPGSVYGFPVTAALSDTVNLGNAGQPAGTTSQYIVADIPAAAALTGLYGRTPAVDPGNTRSVSEAVKGAYLEFDTKGELFGLRYAFNGGVRYAKTNQSSTGLINGVAVTVKRDYDDWLPSFNVALYPTEDIIVRGAIAKVMTRPTLGNLTPGGSADGNNYTITNGNPQLDPFRATSYDLGIEWYFAPQSIASIALFKKSIDSFPVSTSRTQTLTEAGLTKAVLLPSSAGYINYDRNPGQLYTVSTTVNGTGASLKGIELSVQAPFRFLPGFLKNFGGIANATLIDSSASYGVVGPSTLVCATAFTCRLVQPVAVQRSSTLFGLSKKAFNGTLYYEDTKFSARGSVSYRGPYVDQNSGTGNVFEGYAATTNIDASVRYRFTKWLEVSIEGTNLIDTYRERYTDLDANRDYENNHFGRTILFGARLKL